MMSGSGENPTQSTEKTAVRIETLGSEEAGQRVDKVLARLLPGVPYTRLFRLFRKGEVRLNGKRVSGEVRVAEGDVSAAVLLDCARLSVAILLASAVAG